MQKLDEIVLLGVVRMLSKFQKRIQTMIHSFFSIGSLFSLSIGGGMMVARTTMEPLANDGAPRYLYKILSYPNWVVTQKRKIVALSDDDRSFIHLATAEQVERIIKKHWASADSLAVLKIDAAQLQGTLKFEANPKGGEKYYHLYDGEIPIQSIVETQIRLQNPFSPSKEKVLEIVQAGDLTLRQKARPLTQEEILSPEIQDLIEVMKTTMRKAPGVGLAAPQIGKSIQLAVIEDMQHSHLTPAEIKERDQTKVPFQVMINPILHLEGEERASFFEGCLSVPGLVAVVPRAKFVRVDCLNEKGEPTVIFAKGWHARILQHEIDHLQGTIYLDRAIKETVMTDENYVDLWRGQSVKHVCDCLVP